MRPTRRPRRTSVAVVAVVAVALGACSSDDGSVRASDLAVGDCYDDPAGPVGDTVLVLSLVACDEPHDNEVIATWRFGEADAYPGEAIVELATTGCLERFEAYVGIAYADSALEVAPLLPTPGGWAVGDRLVVCSAHEADGTPRTGTVRDSRG